MLQFQIENLSFTYPNGKSKALDLININVEKGEFITIFGKSGCGKTTLVKMLKPQISPKGEISGEIKFENETLTQVDKRRLASEIGFVGQNIDYQIVTHTPRSELAFALQNTGISSEVITMRIAEISSYFSMSSWLDRKINELSGGQKQLLSLASVLILYPKVLVLDEPTSQLDPMASEIFVDTLRKINSELGITIIITEHRLENILPICDRAIILNSGKKIFDGKVKDLFSTSIDENTFIDFLPTPMKIFSKLNFNDNCPITINEGRQWLEKTFNSSKMKVKAIEKQELKQENSTSAIELKNIAFSYNNSRKILFDVDLKINQGSIHAIFGANGDGKTTMLKIMTGVLKPSHGKVKVFGTNIKKISEQSLYGDLIGVMPQKVETMFCAETVAQQLEDQLKSQGLTHDEISKKIVEITETLALEPVLLNHPYDISGGQMQKLALALVLLQNPKIIFMDEPTQGMDSEFKLELANILKNLKAKGKTIVIISHDTEFCANLADYCSLVFDTKVVTTQSVSKFFCENFFFTTAARKMSRNLFENAITVQEVVSLCKQNL